MSKPQPGRKKKMAVADDDAIAWTMRFETVILMEAAAVKHYGCNHDSAHFGRPT
jgi:hypothetical protein